MKKIILLLVCIVGIPLLSGCFSNVFENTLVPEEYSYYSQEVPIPLNDEYGSIVYFSFSITPITKEEYLEAESINVMPDYAIKDTYYNYSILLLVRFDEDTSSNKDVEFIGPFVNAPAYDFRSVIHKYDPNIEIIFRIWPRSSENNGIADYLELQIDNLNGECLSNRKSFNLQVTK